MNVGLHKNICQKYRKLYTDNFKSRKTIFPKLPREILYQQESLLFQLASFSLTLHVPVQCYDIRAVYVRDIQIVIYIVFFFFKDSERDKALSMWNWESLSLWKKCIMMVLSLHNHIPGLYCHIVYVMLQFPESWNLRIIR